MLQQFQLAAPLLLTWQHGCQLCSVTWMPAVFVPQLGIAMGQLRPVSSLLVSASDYTFSTPMCARDHQDMSQSSYKLEQHCSSSSCAGQLHRRKQRGAAARFVNTACVEHVAAGMAISSCQ